MKQSKEIIGLQIISIEKGTQEGSVKDLVLDSQDGTLAFLLVNQAKEYLGVKVIPFQDIIGIGGNAVTISKPEVLQDIVLCKSAQELIEQDVKVIGTKVLTKKGKIIGTVQEVILDEDSGKIAACVYADNGQNRQVKADQIITFGKDLLIVEEPKSDTASVSVQEDFKVEAEPVSEQGTAYENTGEEKAAFNSFEQRQIEFMIGKTVDQDVTLDNGEIIPAGEVITAELAQKVTSRKTLMEVSVHLNNQLTND